MGHIYNKNMKNDNHYIYFHKHPINNNLFYIGIGYNNRCYKFTSGRNKLYLDYIKHNGTPLVEIYKNNITREEACILEIKLINKYGRVGIDEGGILLNRSSGGGKSNYGVPHSDETKRKISESLEGKPKHSLEQKKKWSKDRSGKTHNWGDKISKTNKGKPKPDGFGTGRYRKVIQFDLDGNFIKEWDCFRDVYQELGIRNASIWSNIKGITKQSGGFTWKYK